MLISLLHAAGLAALGGSASPFLPLDNFATQIYPDKVVEGRRAVVTTTAALQPQILPIYDATKPMAGGQRRPVPPPLSLPEGSSRRIGAPKGIGGAPSKLWPTIDATGWDVPDPSLAVGTAHAVVAVNSAIAFYGREFFTLQFRQNLTTFFSDIGVGDGATVYRPRVLYDRQADRFYVVALEKDATNLRSKILLAVSDDGDPNGSWYKYRIEAKRNVNGNAYWLDFPCFAYNKDALIVTGNLVNFASGTAAPHAGVDYHLIPKAALLTGGAYTDRRLRDPDAFSCQMAQVTDATEPSLYGVSDYNPTTLKSAVVTAPATAPVLTTAMVAVPTHLYPTQYATSTTNFLDPGDGRLLSAGWRNHRLVTASTVRGETDATNKVRWYELDFTNAPSTPPGLVRSGEIASPKAGEHYFTPSAAFNPAGDLTVFFTRSSTLYAADMMCVTAPAAYTGTNLGAPYLLATSNYTTFGKGGQMPWGESLQVVTDPSNDSLFWGVGIQAYLYEPWQANVYSWKMGQTVTALSLSPTTAYSPSGGVSIVTISQNPEPNGTSVSLWSDDPHVTCLPAYFAKGKTSANGDLRIGGVFKETVVRITASSGGVTVSNTLTIKPGATILGQVSFQDYLDDPLKVSTTLYAYANKSSSPNRSFPLKLESDGSFRLPTDIYIVQDVAVKAPHWLSVRVANVPLYGQETVTLAPMSLINGDVNGDDKIDDADQAALTAAFRSTPESANWNPNADLNGDGVVGGSDQAILSKNYGKRGGLG